MIYYSSWQEALIAYVNERGSEYENSYALIEEFEHHLHINKNGTYFMYTGRK